MTYPSIYPTGTTIYNPKKCFNGYTVFHAKELGSLVIDMNGGEAKLWKGLHGFPNKILKGDYILGHKFFFCTQIADKNLLDDTIYEVSWEGDNLFHPDNIITDGRYKSLKQN